MIIYYKRPIPCGQTGTYAHYGLIDGLLGLSIGSLHQDVRYYLDRLVQLYPEAFERSIINSEKHSSGTAGKFATLKRDLNKWRWRLIDDYASKTATQKGKKICHNLCSSVISIHHNYIIPSYKCNLTNSFHYVIITCTYKYEYI